MKEKVVLADILLHLGFVIKGNKQQTEHPTEGRVEVVLYIFSLHLALNPM